MPVMTKAYGPLFHTSGWYTTSPAELNTPPAAPAREPKVIRRSKAGSPVQKPATTPVVELGRALAKAWGCK